MEVCTSTLRNKRRSGNQRTLHRRVYQAGSYAMSKTELKREENNMYKSKKYEELNAKSGVLGK